MTLSSFLLVATIQLLAVISPGPDFALIVKTALTRSRATALMTALGIVSGILVHLTYCLLGLAVLIAQSHQFFFIIKYLGAFYFIYLGIKGLLEGRPASSDIAVSFTGTHWLWQAFKSGFLCNLLNIKCVLFFLGLFTLIIKPTTPWWVQLIYASEIIFISLIWFISLAVAITHPWMKRRIGQFQYTITKLMGLLLIFFGLEIALIQHL